MLVSYASAPDTLPQGAYLSCNLPLHALVDPNIVGSLIAIARLRPVLRIHGLDPSLLERAQELQTLRAAGFLVCLYGYEVGALDEEKLKSLPMDFVVMDSQLTGNKRAFVTRIPLLQHMSKICAKFHIRMLFQEIDDIEMLDLLKQIDDRLASDPLFGKTLESAQGAAAVMMPS